MTDAISTLAGNLNIKTETQTKLQKDIERRVTGKEKEVEDNFRNITELSNYMKENAEDINNVFNNGGQLVIDNKVFSKEERGLGLCLLKEVAKDLGANYQADKEDGIITKLYISANGNS